MYNALQRVLDYLAPYVTDTNRIHVSVDALEASWYWIEIQRISKTAHHTYIDIHVIRYFSLSFYRLDSAPHKDSRGLSGTHRDSQGLTGTHGTSHGLTLTHTDSH